MKIVKINIINYNYLKNIPNLASAACYLSNISDFTGEEEMLFPSRAEFYFDSFWKSKKNNYKKLQISILIPNEEFTLAEDKDIE